MQSGGGDDRSAWRGASGYQVSALRLADGELEQFEFVSPDEALRRLSDRTRRWLSAAITALRTGGAAYLENGEDPNDPWPGL